MRILIVDDHKGTADSICQGLNEYYFQAEAVYDGAEAIYQISEMDYAAVVLDVNLPIVNGWEVLAAIRDKKPELPVLMLSACDDVDSRVKGLDSGADDYLIKPFAFNELLARIKSLLRRPVHHVSSQLTVHDLRINMQKHKATRGEQRLNLSAKEFMLLAYLMRRQGEVLSRRILAENVWDIHFNSNTNVIDVAVKRLREKIDTDHAVKLIHTVRGVGYVLEVRS